eukprot:36071-Chlamydomonas_euryale.AAC.5
MEAAPQEYALAVTTRDGRTPEAPAKVRRGSVAREGGGEQERRRAEQLVYTHTYAWAQDCMVK